MSNLLKSALSCALIAFSLSFYAQGGDFDQRLLSIYSQEQILDMQTYDNDILNYWEYYLDNGFIIVDYNEKRDGELKNEIDHSDNFNLLGLDIYPTNKTQKFVIRNSNKVLMVLPKDKLISKYNSFNAENKI